MFHNKLLIILLPTAPGHSSSTFGMTMHNLQYIAKNGLEKYKADLYIQVTVCEYCHYVFDIKKFIISNPHSPEFIIPSSNNNLEAIYIYLLSFFFIFYTINKVIHDFSLLDTIFWKPPRL